MGHIDTHKLAKNPTGFTLKDLSGAGSPFLRAVQEVSKEEGTRQNALTVMRPQRVRATRVTDPGDRGGTSDRLGEFKAQEILSKHDWAQRAHPDLAAKRQLPRYMIEQLDREYQQYIATQKAVGELALGGAQENRLRFVANQRARGGGASLHAMAGGGASGGRGGAIPANIAGQVGFAMLTGVDPKTIEGLREVLKLSRGTGKGGTPALKVNIPQVVKDRAAAAMRAGKFDDPNITILFDAATGRRTKKKEKSLEDQLGQLALAELVMGEEEGPRLKLYRDWLAIERAPQPPGEFAQELALGSREFGTVGFLEAITSPATWLEEERKVGGAALRFMGPEADQQRIKAALGDKAREFLPAAEAEHRRGKITDDELNRMRLYAGVPPLAPPAAGVPPAAGAPQKNGTKGKFVLPPFLGE